MLLFILAIACTDVSPDTQAGKDEGKMEYASKKINESRPPLDQSVPEELKTATLAMG